MNEIDAVDILKVAEKIRNEQATVGMKEELLALHKIRSEAIGAAEYFKNNGNWFLSEEATRMAEMCRYMINWLGPSRSIKSSIRRSRAYGRLTRMKDFKLSRKRLA